MTQLSRASPHRGTFIRRLQHQIADFYSVFSFGLPHCFDARVRVGASILRLRQWSGSQVGSGGHVWGASRRLCAYMEQYGDGAPATVDAPAIPSRSVGTLRLVDLGAGTGAVGLAASILGFADVTLTDQASYIYPTNRGESLEVPMHTLLDLCTVNVQHNQPVLQAYSPSGCTARPLPQVARLLWGDATDLAALPHQAYEVICGGDILLFEPAMPELLETINRISGATTVVIIEHTDRGM